MDIVVIKMSSKCSRKAIKATKHYVGGPLLHCYIHSIDGDLRMFYIRRSPTTVGKVK